MRGGWLSPMAGMLMGMVPLAWSADSEVLRQRVPTDQIESAREVTNPLQATPEVLGKGKALFEGKAFCRACHGADGKGAGHGPGLFHLQGTLATEFYRQDVATGENGW